MALGSGGSAAPRPMDEERPKRAVKVIVGHLQQPVSMRIALPNGGSRNWTGKKIWTSSLVLADWLARQPSPSPVDGARVLELGCGSAPLPAAVAALRGAASCEATDGDPTAVIAARANLADCADLNAVPLERRPQAWRLDWSEAKTASSAGAYDVILFADAIYTEEVAVSLAECIDHTLRSCSEARVYGAAAHTRVGASDFCREMRLRGFVAEEIEVGCSAAAEQDAIRGIEGCDSREDALQLGPCIVASWRRGPAEEGSRDDGRRLELFFDQALGEAERAVAARLEASGYVPGE